MLAVVAVYAVVSLTLGESAKKPTIEGAGDFLQSDPAPPTYHVGMLYPEDGRRASELAGVPLRDGVAKQRVIAAPANPLPEHDPLTAYVYDPGWTLPTPAPPPSAPVQAAQGALSEGEFDSHLLAAGVPIEWWADFKAIAHCESRWRPEAIGDGGNSIGLMQMWYGWASKAGVTDLLDPVQNLIAAKYVREVRGRYGGGGGWSCAETLGIP